MTQNEIIEMAKQSDLMADGEMWFSPTYGNADVHITDLERFAKLVAAKEREACAEICKKHADVYAGLEQNPTPAEYAMGYAEGFNDACKPKQGDPSEQGDKHE